MMANDWMGLRQLGEPEIEGETAGAVRTEHLSLETGQKAPFIHKQPPKRTLLQERDYSFILD